jgi:hypothetical protein
LIAATPRCVSVVKSIPTSVFRLLVVAFVGGAIDREYPAVDCSRAHIILDYKEF